MPVVLNNMDANVEGEKLASMMNTLATLDYGIRELLHKLTDQKYKLKYYVEKCNKLYGIIQNQ